MNFTYKYMQYCPNGETWEILKGYGRYESDVQEFHSTIEEQGCIEHAELMKRIGAKPIMVAKFIVRKLNADEAHDTKKYPWIAKVWNKETSNYEFATWSPKTQARTAKECIETLNEVIVNPANADKWSEGWNED